MLQVRADSGLQPVCSVEVLLQLLFPGALELDLLDLTIIELAAPNRLRTCDVAKCGESPNRLLRSNRLHDMPRPLCRP